MMTSIWSLCGEHRRKREMPNLPTLSLSRRIVNAFRYDDFVLVIIHGTQRIGKSAYSIKVMGQVIDYFFGEDIFKVTGSTGFRRAPNCQKYMGWDPEEVVDLWYNLLKRIPNFAWDDAGMWLFSLNWTDPLLIAVQQYMNVVGTDMNCLMLTTPDPTWILSKIAGNPGMIRVEITKTRGGNSDADSVRFSRKAVGYRPWKTKDLKGGGVNKILIDDYSCKLPQEFYDWYKPTRERYAQVAKLRMREELMRRRMKAIEKEEKLRKKTKKSK